MRLVETAGSRNPNTFSTGRTGALGRSRNQDRSWSAYTVPSGDARNAWNSLSYFPPRIITNRLYMDCQVQLGSTASVLCSAGFSLEDRE